jgi:hypothetical protein
MIRNGGDNSRATAGSPDLRNPRLPAGAMGQRKAFRAIAERQNRKSHALAEHVVSYLNLSFYLSTPNIIRYGDEPCQKYLNLLS